MRHSLLLIIFVSCSNMSDKSNTERISAKSEVIEKVIDLVNKEKFDSLIELNKPLIRVQTAQGGGGDCFGVVHEFVGQDSAFQIVNDRWDCGDYGFTLKQYISYNDQLIATKMKEFQWTGDSVNEYLITEEICYINTDSSEIRTRQRPSNNYYDTLISNDIIFNSRIVPIDSLKVAKTKELMEAFTIILLSE